MRLSGTSIYFLPGARKDSLPKKMARMTGDSNDSFVIVFQSLDVVCQAIYCVKPSGYQQRKTFEGFEPRNAVIVLLPVPRVKQQHQLETTIRSSMPFEHWVHPVRWLRAAGRNMSEHMCFINSWGRCVLSNSACEMALFTRFRKNEEWSELLATLVLHLSIT